MAYTRGTSSNIIVGAAALFAYSGPIGLDSNGQITDVEAENDLPAYEPTGTSGNLSGTYKSTLQEASGFTNVGYTMNGLEIQFQPDFGEVQVDQVLDVAKLYKQGMQVNLNTAFAEATLENLLFAIAGQSGDLGNLVADTGISSASKQLDLSAGDIGECPVERGLVAVGPGTGDCAAGSSIERIYVAYRALSIDNVTVSAKRDEPSMFEVSFRLLPNDDASYGKIVDRVIASS
jgi:hypothetical protein